MHVVATLSYDGGNYFGLVKQKHHTTVLGRVEELFVTLGITSAIQFCGRTDTGVHAINQTIDFILPEHFTDLVALQQLLNTKLPSDIRFKTLKPAPERFHARFSTKSRIYRYAFSLEENVFTNRFAPYLDNTLDFEAIKNAIGYFEGVHDFSMFRKVGTPTKDNIREIYKATCYKRGQFYLFYFHGNGFLRSQIRLMVGFLLEIGRNHLTLKQLEEQLLSIQQHHNKPVPPNGLYFVRGIYTS